MKSKFKPIYVVLICIVVGIIMLINSYNNIQTYDEKVTASWSEVLNQYQRRADLIPNLVNTVKAYATHEQKVFTDVTNARAKVGSVQINATQLTDQAAMARFQEAQGELSSAISRLLAVSENYPDLKSSELYSNLMVQLEGTENRIGVVRGRYIDTIQIYNSYIRRLPGTFIASYMDYKPKAQFTVENPQQISQVPVVNFG